MNILIESKEWFDKVNGNSYFSSRVEVDGYLQAVLPFQYGYGSHCDDMALKELLKQGITNTRSYYGVEEQGHKIKSIKHERCLQREVKSWGTE